MIRDDCEGGCNGSYSRTASCCGRSRTKHASLRARHGRAALEPVGPGRVLGLRRSADIRRRTRVLLYRLFEPMAKSMESFSMVGALRHAVSPKAVPLATVSRRASVAKTRTDCRTLPCAASGGFQHGRESWRKYFWPKLREHQPTASGEPLQTLKSRQCSACRDSRCGLGVSRVLAHDS